MQRLYNFRLLIGFKYWWIIVDSGHQMCQIILLQFWLVFYLHHILANCTCNQYFLWIIETIFLTYSAYDACCLILFRWNVSGIFWTPPGSNNMCSLIKIWFQMFLIHTTSKLRWTDIWLCLVLCCILCICCFIRILLKSTIDFEKCLIV